MKAITLDSHGGPEVLRLEEVPDPGPSPQQLLVRVRAAGVNRADILQRQGSYPPPPGESDILGLELSGEVIGAGSSGQGFAPGDRVFALVGGGAYGERAVIDHRMAMRVPEGWTFAQAASVPESFFTAQENLFTLGDLREGETVLIHAAGSGVGTAAVQMARAAGTRVLVTAGSTEKIRKALELGAEAGCSYKERDFAGWVSEKTGGEGVDLVLDFIGAKYWERNLRSLRKTGRLLLVGLLGGAKVEVDLGVLLRRRLKVFGSVLRSRPLEEKIEITRRFSERCLPLLASGVLRPVIDRVLPLAEAAEAHRIIEANANFGKIVLEVPP